MFHSTWSLIQLHLQGESSLGWVFYPCMAVLLITHSHSVRQKKKIISCSVANFIITSKVPNKQTALTFFSASGGKFCHSQCFPDSWRVAQQSLDWWSTGAWGQGQRSSDRWGLHGHAPAAVVWCLLVAGSPCWLVGRKCRGWSRCWPSSTRWTGAPCWGNPHQPPCSSTLLWSQSRRIYTKWKSKNWTQLIMATSMKRKYQELCKKKNFNQFCTHCFLRIASWHSFVIAASTIVPCILPAQCSTYCTHKHWQHQKHTENTVMQTLRAWIEYILYTRMKRTPTECSTYCSHNQGEHRVQYILFTQMLRMPKDCSILFTQTLNSTNRVQCRLFTQTSRTPTDCSTYCSHKHWQCQQTAVHTVHRNTENTNRLQYKLFTQTLNWTNRMQYILFEHKHWTAPTDCRTYCSHKHWTAPTDCSTY